MNYTTRTLVVLGGLAALAATSQAQINITPLDSSVVVTGSNQASITPPTLSQFQFGPSSTLTDSGAFTISAVGGLTDLNVTQVSGNVNDGTLSLLVTISGGSLAHPYTLYSDSTATDNPLIVEMDNHFNTPQMGTYTVSYTASMTLPNSDSYGTLGGLTVQAAAVPEPSAYAALGVGLVGLMARRRRSAK